MQRLGEIIYLKVNIIQVSTITPLRKVSHIQLLDNLDFRPMNSLPIVAKILGKTECEQLLNYITEANILSRY